MSNSDSTDNDNLSTRIVEAIAAEDIVLLESLIRGGEFILFQQIDPETGLVDQDEDGNFNVVIAELEDDMAVVCFTDSSIADKFVETAVEDLPVGSELPRVMLDGDTLLDGLPEDCGLLLNPTSEEECFFPPGTFEVGEYEDEEE